MSENNIETYTGKDLAAIRRRGEGRTNWVRLDERSDSDIDFSDISEIEKKMLAGAKLVRPGSRQKISINVDRDVLEYFRKDGPGYQKRMNAALKSFVWAHQDKKK